MIAKADFNLLRTIVCVGLSDKSIRLHYMTWYVWENSPRYFVFVFLFYIFSQNSTESNQQLVGYRVTSLCCLPVSRMKNCCWKWEYIETTSMKQWSFIDRERRRKGKTNVRAKTVPNRREMNRCKYIKRMRWINFQLSMKSLDLNGRTALASTRKFLCFFFFVLFQIRYQFGVCFVSLQPAVYSFFFMSQISNFTERVVYVGSPWLQACLFFFFDKALSRAHAIHA